MWYTINTQANREKSAAQDIYEKLKDKHGDDIIELFVPTQKETVVTAGGKKRIVDKVRFTGYIFLNANLTDQLLIDINALRTNNGIIQSNGKPVTVPDRDIEKMKQFEVNTQTNPVQKAKFTEGQVVDISSGGFAGSQGTIKTVNEANQSATVQLMVFGRAVDVIMQYKYLKAL